MARANFVKKAQKDIYETGKYVSYVSEKGKRKGETKSKLDRTIPSGKNDKIIIKKGESYYWWQFKNRPKSYSKTKPKPSQLTQSAYLSELYSIQEDIENIRGNVSDKDDLESSLEEIKSRLEELKETTEGSLENMPEGLQQGDTGQLLQERIDALESAIDELEGIDLDFEEPEIDELKEEISERDSIEEDDVEEDLIEELKQEKLGEWLDEKCEEISGITLE